MKNEKFLEEFYENVILPKYGNFFNTAEIKWLDHGRLDDSYVWAHYFEDNGKQYVLLSNDYAGGSQLDDGLSYEIVKYGDKTGLKLSFDDGKEVENITGQYTLYREKKI